AAPDRAYDIAAKVLIAQAEVRLDRSKIPEALTIVENAKREVSARKMEPIALLEFVRGDILARLGRVPEAKAAFEEEIANFPCHRREVATYPNAPVILISIDTVRADHLPMFGYRGLETPNLDAFRDEAVLFTNAYSQVPLTLPSHTSILTGLLPPQNGVRNNIGYVLDPKIVTIPGFLK